MTENPNILIIYKATILPTLGTLGPIYDLTRKYANKFPYATSYFVLCDENITNNIEINENDNIIKIKMKENNWDSLLIKVIKAMEKLKTDIINKYSHVVVSNISTFINIPILYRRIKEHIDKPCLSIIGEYEFNNIKYKFASGACYIFSKNLTLNILEYFQNKNFITFDNTLTEKYSKNNPTTDDIGFGYYLHNNGINIYEIDRFNIHSKMIESDIKNLLNYSHVRIKSLNQDIDFNSHQQLYNIIYS